MTRWRERFGESFRLTLVTDDAALAARADRAGVNRIGVDIERLGKAASRQACGLHAPAQAPQRQGIALSEWATDKGPAEGAARRDLSLDRARRLRGKRSNNRAESSRVPIRRRREWKMQAFM